MEQQLANLVQLQISVHALQGMAHHCYWQTPYLQMGLQAKIYFNSQINTHGTCEVIHKYVRSSENLGPLYTIP